MSARYGWKAQDRLTALVPLILIALFAAVVFWLDARVTEGARERRKAAQNVPDFFLENFKVERTAADGRIESKMEGTRATHFPTTDSTVVEAAKYESQPAGKPKMEVAANKAVFMSVPENTGDAQSKYSKDKKANAKQIERVEFAGNVVAVQGASPGREAVTYSSDTLTVFPKTHIARTDSATRTVSGDRVMTTQGLNVNAENKQGETKHGISIELKPKD